MDILKLDIPEDHFWEFQIGHDSIGVRLYKTGDMDTDSKVVATYGCGNPDNKLAALKRAIRGCLQQLEQKDETPGKDYNTCTDTLYRCPKCFRYNTAPSGCLSCS
jgi:hypothetical protein